MLKSWIQEHYLYQHGKRQSTFPLHLGQGLSDSPAWMVKVSIVAASKNLGLELPLEKYVKMKKTRLKMDAITCRPIWVKITTKSLVDYAALQVSVRKAVPWDLRYQLESSWQNDQQRYKDWLGWIKWTPREINYITIYCKNAIKCCTMEWKPYWTSRKPLQLRP